MLALASGRFWKVRAVWVCALSERRAPPRDEPWRALRLGQRGGSTHRPFAEPPGPPGRGHAFLRCQDITFPLRGPSEPGACHAEEPVQIPSVVIVTAASGRDMSSEPCHCRSQ